jgi:hypothetical protein
MQLPSSIAWSARDLTDSGRCQLTERSDDTLLEGRGTPYLGMRCGLPSLLRRIAERLERGDQFLVDRLPRLHLGECR